MRSTKNVTFVRTIQLAHLAEELFSLHHVGTRTLTAVIQLNPIAVSIALKRKLE